MPKKISTKDKYLPKLEDSPPDVVDLFASGDPTKAKNKKMSDTMIEEDFADYKKPFSKMLIEKMKYGVPLKENIKKEMARRKNLTAAVNKNKGGKRKTKKTRKH